MPDRDALEAMLERVRAFCGHPRMMDPEFVTDPSEHPLSEQLLGSFGCFSAAENRVYINLAEVLFKLGPENLEPVLVYQFLHYALAPFDVRTALRLTLAARLALEETGGRGASFEEARAIQRLFCDVICVTYAARQGRREEMIGLYRAMDRLRINQPDPSWRALLTLFEELWECRGELAGMVEPEMRDDARGLALRFLERPFAASGWTSKVRLLAVYLQKYYEEQEQLEGSRLMDNGIDDLRSRDARKMLRTLASEMGVEDFKDLAEGLGEGEEKSALAWYYRDLARRWEVRFHPARGVGGEDVPYAPHTWGMGHPFERLDLPYTLYTAGVAVPTLTTKQWEKTVLQVLQTRRTPPDVLIILDASSSMTDPSREISHAVLAGFVMARSAINLGAKVGLIVYSDQRKNLTIDYSWNLRPVERGLVTFYGGGTVFPVRDFVRLAEMEPHRPKHFCLISDTEITNIEEAAGRLADALEVHPENSGSVFLIDQDRNHKAEMIRAVGYDVFPVSRGEDLVRVVAGKAEELYMA
jgi:hypothetical protein